MHRCRNGLKVKTKRKKSFYSTRGWKFDALLKEVEGIIIARQKQGHDRIGVETLAHSLKAKVSLVHKCIMKLTGKLIGHKEHITGDGCWFPSVYTILKEEEE